MNFDSTIQVDHRYMDKYKDFIIVNISWKQMCTDKHNELIKLNGKSATNFIQISN